MEFEQLMQELLGDEKREDMHTNYFDVVASNSPRSPLYFDAVQILPPILSESEKQVMREYRRKAVHLEQRHFEARRKKYSNLLLKVMELSEKFEASERQQNGVPSQTHSKPLTTTEQSIKTQVQAASENVQPLPYNFSQSTTRYQSKNDLANEKDTTQEISIAKKDRSFEDNEVIAASIFQKPRIHHSSTSPDKDRNRPVNASLVGNIPSTMSNNKPTMSTRENSALEKTTTANSSLQSNIQEMSIDKSISTLHNSALEYPRVDSSSSARNAPSELSIDESLSTLRNSTLGIDSTSISTSTMKSSHQKYVRAALSSDELESDPSDSLASTVLSMAFTDSSIASQQSVLGVTDQPVKPVQRQLNMDKANHNLYQSYHQNVKPQTSTPHDGHKKHSSSKPAVKKAISSINSSDSRTTYTKTDYEQDKALEKLEIMRKKLLEEKEKHMIQIKQQELSRLRKSKSRAQSAPLGHYSGGATDVYSQGHVSSRPNSDMYSIAEQSFEGTSSFRQSNHNELESASDKENNICRDNQDYYSVYQAHHNYEVLNDNETNEFSDNLPERYSSEIIDSRPISIHSKQHVGKPDHRKSDLYVRHEFQKQIEIEMSKETNGRDKFSVLSAYAKGFMTRHLLKSEKVQELIKTVKDITEFLGDISREGKSSHQREDKSLQERVQTQLVAAKTKLYDVFFTIPIKERMAYIAHSRNAAREREDRIITKRSTESKQLTRKLSAATMKAMQRRQGETNNNNSTTSDVKKASPPRPSSQLRKRRSVDTRALRPVQSTKSPQGAGRSQTKRRSLASPLARRSIGKKTTNSRVATASGSTRLPSNRKSFGRSSIEAEKQNRPSRQSLDNGLSVVKRNKPNIANDNNVSKLPVKKLNSKSSLGSATYRVPNELCKDLGQNRPSTASAVSQASKIQQTNDRPKSALTGSKRITRSMAAQFKKS